MLHKSSWVGYENRVFIPCNKNLPVPVPLGPSWLIFKLNIVTRTALHNTTQYTQNTSNLKHRYINLKQLIAKKFSYLIFSRFIIFTFRNYFILWKTVLCIWRKIIFFCHHNYVKKVILTCLKMNLKISHKLR